MNEWIELLREFGFPVFMVIWFMLRTEKIIEKNTEALKLIAKYLGDRDTGSA